jgi:hypothetical protein
MSKIAYAASWLTGDLDVVTYRCQWTRNLTVFIGRRLPTIPDCWRLSWRGWGWNIEFKVFRKIA